MAQQDRFFGCASFVAFGAGALLVLTAAYLYLDLPPQRQYADNAADYNAAIMEAFTALVFGVFMLLAGLAFFLRSSARRRRIAYADAEFTAEAVARGIKRGLDSDS